MAGWSFDPCRPGVPAIEFAIPRDETFLRLELIPACLEFWKTISSGKAPPQDPQRDLYMPAGDALTKWTHAAHEYRGLASERRDLEAKLKAVKAKQDDLEGDFVGQMGDYLLAETAGIKVTRYLQNGSVDYQALLKDLAPDLDEATMNRFRREPSQRVKVTVQSETAVPAPGLAPAEAHFYF